MQLPRGSARFSDLIEDVLIKICVSLDSYSLLAFAEVSWATKAAVRRYFEVKQKHLTVFLNVDPFRYLPNELRNTDDNHWPWDSRRKNVRTLHINNWHTFERMQHSGFLLTGLSLHNEDLLRLLGMYQTDNIKVQFPKLSSLAVHGSNFSGFSLNMIANITELYIDRWINTPTVTFPSLRRFFATGFIESEFLARHRLLTHLAINNDFHALANNLIQMPRLEVLALRYFIPGVEQVQLLRNLRSLKSLEMCVMTNPYNQTVFGDILREADGLLESLETLKVGYDAGVEPDWAAFGLLRSLRQLDLNCTVDFGAVQAMEGRAQQFVEQSENLKVFKISLDDSFFYFFAGLLRTCEARGVKLLHNFSSPVSSFFSDTHFNFFMQQ